MADNNKPVEFVVPGARLESSDATQQSIRLQARSRAAATMQRVSAQPGQDVVELHIENGPVLTLHPEHARLLIESQASAQPRERSSDALTVPTQLAWRGSESAASRGVLGDVALELFNVVAGTNIAERTALEIAKALDARAGNGVFELTPDRIGTLVGAGKTGIPPNAQALVLLHGTFVTTADSFGDLWTKHPHRVAALFKHYGKLFALDHATLTESPIENALALALACGKGTRLHLLTHSRGGLVAEILAHVCAQPERATGRLSGIKFNAAERAALGELANVVKARAITVERIVRVACPARGTLLASKRFDAYLSVFRWCLERAGVPVIPTLVEFLRKVAQTRFDADKLPGAAALSPDSPMVRWLHEFNDGLPGDLRIIAGDTESDSLGSWLKKLVADAYYWTDNDLIVHTSSMYGGAPRKRDACFMLDRSARTDHFSYFTNESTAAAVVDGLICADPPEAFRSIGPLSWDGKSSSGVRGRRDATGEADRPCVFVLPGVLGSHLKVDGERIWYGARLIAGLDRLRYPDDARRVEPDGTLENYSDALCDHLAQTHAVRVFAYDWRRPLEEEAQRLGRHITQALDERAASGQPVRILAHSMGGILARTLQLECPALWDRMLAHPDARLVMLGVPNHGSWAPMQVLSGDDPVGNLIAMIGAPFQHPKARGVMAQFPGFLQVQAADPKLATTAGWEELAKADADAIRRQSMWHLEPTPTGALGWGIPKQAVLDHTHALRQRLDAQLGTTIPRYRQKLAIVVGHATLTPDGYAIDDTGLVYLHAREAGDGRVTHQSARLDGVSTWSVDCVHGDMTRHAAAFPAYVDLLSSGTTTKLEIPAEATRGEASRSVALVRARPAHMRASAEAPDASMLFAAVRDDTTTARAARRRPLLRIRVHNGDLAFVREPLMLGHYRSLMLTGTESIANRLIGGTMQEALALDHYPVEPGTHQIFANVNPLQVTPRPECVIVVGLGAEGRLDRTKLVQTVRSAVVAYAQRQIESARAPKRSFALAATLIGSGGANAEAGRCAQDVARGVQEANDALAKQEWPIVSELCFVELYLDRASEAWRALRIQAGSATGCYELAPTVTRGSGTLLRPIDPNYRGTGYDFIAAIAETGANPNDSTIVYTVDTRRARNERYTQSIQARLTDELIRDASRRVRADAELRRTLFRLLVPIEMETLLGDSTELVLELDRGTAPLAWELIDTPGRNDDPRPWAVRSKLVRKIALDYFRARPIDADAHAFALVIGEPDTPADYGRLPGARAEATKVADLLGRDEEVERRIAPDDERQPRPDAATVINALLERDWRIVHVAGHGAPPQLAEDGRTIIDPRGVVLSNGVFLGPREIRSMRIVPELVFVNCCHLARNAPAQSLANHNWSAFAAGVAEELIRIGVKCVVAAGWAVDDSTAANFAETFYTAILQGQRFIDAVGAARERAWKERLPGDETWAAYQCYGDPDWYLRRNGDRQHQRSELLGERYANIATAEGLALALDEIAVSATHSHDQAAGIRQRIRLEYLGAQFKQTWAGVGRVAEAFGNAWRAVGDRARAIERYEAAVAAADGSASLKAREQLGNMRARHAVDLLADDPAAARALVDTAIKDLLELEPVTVERAALLASAYKRKAIILAATDRRSEPAALRQMLSFYRKAERLARETNSANLFYPALNRMMAEIVTPGAAIKPFDRTEVSEIRRSIEAKQDDDADFWSSGAEAELETYLALAAGKLRENRARIEQRYAALAQRVDGLANWRSVIEQLEFLVPRIRRRIAPGEAAAADALLTAVKALVDEKPRATTRGPKKRVRKR